MLGKTKVIVKKNVLNEIKQYKKNLENQKCLGN